MDTNVLVYFYDPNSQRKQKEAEAVLSRLHENGLGKLSVQILAELVNVALRKLDPPLTVDIPDKQLEIDPYCVFVRLAGSL